MKRIGGKGEGKWQRISPEEALGTIALRIRWAKEEYGPKSIAFIHCDGPRGNFEPACALTNAPGNRMIYGADAHYYFRPQGVACMVTFGRGNFFAEHDSTLRSMDMTHCLATENHHKVLTARQICLKNTRLFSFLGKTKLSK